MAFSLIRINLTIVTPEALILECRASGAILPLPDGWAGVMPGHAPLMARLAPGVVQFQEIDHGHRAAFVDGGFVHLIHNQLSILTPMVILKEHADAVKAEQDMIRARTLPQRSIEENEIRNRAIHRAKLILKLAELRESETVESLS